MKTEEVADSILDRAFRILDYVAGESRPVGFSELMEGTGIGRSTVAKILRILCAHGMLSKGEQGYRIGSKAADYARSERAGIDFLGRYRPSLSSLSSRFEVTAMLLRANASNTVCLDKVVAETAPAMRALGSVIEDDLIHPWTLVRRAGEVCLEELVESMVEAAPVSVVKGLEINREAARQMLTSHSGGVVDDLGQVYSHVRRIAVLTDVAPSEGGQGILVTGFFPGAQVDVAELVRAMREAVN